MLAIRMQRLGRRGHAQFRVVVQDSRLSPTSGKVVAQLGNYNPHTKVASLNSEAVQKYLQNGAQPSDRVARLLQKEGVKLPAWVKLDQPKKKTVRNPEKRRSTRPAEELAPEAAAEPEPAEAAVEEAPTEEAASEIPASEADAAPAEQETEA